MPCEIHSTISPGAVVIIVVLVFLIVGLLFWNIRLDNRNEGLERRDRERHLVRKYGVTLDDYAAMLEAQHGLCAICGAAEIEQFKQVFHVDHCHETGKVRGLLCRGCNHVLGHLNDDERLLNSAIAYLRESKSPKSSEGR